MNMKRLVQVSAMVLALALGRGWAQGATFNVVIDDLSETPTATVNGNPVSLLPDSAGEFLHFTLAFSQAENFNGVTVSRDLIEPGTMAISDRLLETSTDHVDIKFSSDPATLPPQGLSIQSPLVEDGTFQLFLAHTFFFSAGGFDLFNYTVRSDVIEAAEPATWLLLAIGLLGVVGYASRQRKRVI